jgi:para-nitrobenzyl esterase
VTALIVGLLMAASLTVAIRYVSPGTATSAGHSVAAKLARFTGKAQRAQTEDCAVPVQTAEGVVCGVTSDGWREYLGVPYAAPPIGALRWQAPQPHVPWTTPLRATQPGPNCLGLAGVAGSEDCLWLNVYVPPTATAASRLPVMVWIHGGAFLVDDDSGNGIGVGTGSGQQLADTENVIVVRISYRLGPFGFLASSGFGDKPGNYGLEDQRAALAWVNRDITQFGGDPGNVTLFGQSAGATSICMQLISPGSRGLFQRAVIESGWYQKFFSAASCSQQLPTLAQAEATARTLTDRVGCSASADVAACLRSVPDATLLAASSGLSFTPVVDGHFIPAQPQTAFTRGQFSRVPIIVGVARNEGSINSVSTWPGYIQMLQADYGANAARVLATYPQAIFPSPTVAAGTVVSDQIVCNALTSAGRLARWVPTYMYRWDDVTEPWYETSTPDKGNVLAGAYHDAELAALFPGWAIPPTPQLTAPDQTAVIYVAMKYWGAFAHDGDPSTGGVLPWPRYTDGTSVMSIQAAYDNEVLNAANVSQTSHCSLWDGITQ